MPLTTTITGLGHKGEGIAEIDGRRVFVPFALAGERVAIAIEGERAVLVEVVEASTDRGEPFCAHFGTCGGCQLQHLARPAYEAFKIGLIETPLRHQGLDAVVHRFIDAVGAGRRRATLHARREGAGYMRMRSHEVADIERCPILVPALARAPEIARAVEAGVGEADVAFTATLAGIDVGVRTERRRAAGDKLIPLLGRFGLARLSLNSELVVQAAPPRVAMGRADVELPIGSFLQATEAAERALADYVCAAVGKAKIVADLFCGVGPFTLRLAETARVLAHDSDRAGIAALDKSARHASGLKQVTAKARDLFRDPLTRFELAGFDCVVLDPPRAGAEAQVREIAASKLRNVVMVSCDPRTFARDARLLADSGFALEDLVAVDQFAWSTHVEIAATFRR
ncbi:class I SAM-dependent RNA methyltransferase [Devosia nitrariae]|uniref:RNA methyltransferase n=1 Tax=Devosia nitrariae TaxID=2071872 RepID=A0ABQ5W3L9_9HYPH|nr:TRAM domain-containing protein [Devosia nitrariae]GLQ54486.1 putative RNA methyltransferase [Devosia nitrariae]